MPDPKKTGTENDYFMHNYSKYLDLFNKNIEDVTELCIVEMFFIVFSRFEYALKRSGYIKNAEEAQPDWDSFADMLEASFKYDEDTEIEKAVSYFKAYPPKKQIITKYHTLGWKECSAPKTLKDLLISIRRVRNNLFHGGKYPDGPVTDPARDKLLLKNSLVILRECLKLCQSIKKSEKYKSVYDYFYEKPYSCND